METPIVFQNKNKKQLTGILHTPKGQRKFPLAFICHGFGSTKTNRRFVRLARILEKKGTASFRFDFEGCGDSEGKFETITIQRQVLDLESAFCHILRRKDIDGKNVAFVGHSLGTLICALFVAQNKIQAKTLIFWAPAFDQKNLMPIWHRPRDLKKWKKQGYFIRKDLKTGSRYFKENVNKDYSPILAEIATPILIIHGNKDEVVPIKFSRKLVKKYNNVKLVPLPKADHGFDDYHIQKKLIQETLRWLKKELFTEKRLVKL